MSKPSIPTMEQSGFLRGRRVHKELLVLKVLLDLRAILVLLVLRGLKDLLDLKGM